jgi:hypothetical protein
VFTEIWRRLRRELIKSQICAALEETRNFVVLTYLRQPQHAIQPDAMEIRYCINIADCNPPFKSVQYLLMLKGFVTSKQILITALDPLTPLSFYINILNAMAAEIKVTN